MGVFLIEEREAEYYDERYNDRWNNLHQYGPSSRSRYRWMLHLMEKYDFEAPLLDAGCGTGEFMGILKRYWDKGRIEGADFSSQALDQARDSGHTIHKVDLKDPSTYPGISYSSLVCSEVIEHVKEDEMILRNLSKLLTSGGKLLLTVPHDKTLMGEHDRNVGHLRRYDREHLVSMCESIYDVRESLTWGGFFYRMYFKFLRTFPPGNLNNFYTTEPGILRRIVLGLLYRAFFVDDFFINSGGGPMLFLILEKP